MENIIWILSTIVIFTLICLILKDLYSKKIGLKKYNELSNIIRPKKIIFYVGIICALILLSLTIFSWFLDTTSTEVEKIIYSSLVILIAIIPNGYLIVFYLNYKITVNEDHFIFQNFWCRKKNIYYKDIIIDKSKMFPQVKIKINNYKTKIIFKLAGILDNEYIFWETYKKWKLLKK